MQLKPDMAETPFNTTQTEIVTENLNTSITHDQHVLSLRRNSFSLNRDPDKLCTSEHVTSCPCLVIYGGKADTYIIKKHRLQNIEKKYIQKILYSLLKIKFLPITNLYLF